MRSIQTNDAVFFFRNLTARATIRAQQHKRFLLPICSRMKILLTGPFGNVGGNVIEQVLENNHKLGRGDHPQRITLTCLDKRTPATELVHARIEKSALGRVAISEGGLVVLWGDLTNPKDVKKAVFGQHAVIHLGAIIPPLAYTNQELAHKVNVGGTKLLIEACNVLERVPRFIYASSYTVYGPQNPHSNLPMLICDTPLNPKDTYATHKVECEVMLRSDYEGEWTIMRLGTITNHLANETNRVPSQVLDVLTFAIPAEQKRHMVHVSDVARAFINAARSDEVDRKVLLIGGDNSWKTTSGDHMLMVFRAMGISMSPLIYRKPARDADHAFYYEGWMDTTESQRLLKYQTVTFEEWKRELRAEVGWAKYAAAYLLAPVIRSNLQKKSPHYEYNKLGTADPLRNKSMFDLVLGEEKQADGGFNITHL